mgnify:CR=1 FL=1
MDTTDKESHAKLNEALDHLILAARYFDFPDGLLAEHGELSLYLYSSIPAHIIGIVYGNFGRTGQVYVIRKTSH